MLPIILVIFHDVHINPQNDRQAESRCYRLSQTRTVTIYKLFIEDSVDAAVADIADRADTSLQIRRSGVDDMQIDDGGVASASNFSAGAAAVDGSGTKTTWKGVVSEALSDVGLFRK